MIEPNDNHVKNLQALLHNIKIVTKDSGRVFITKDDVVYKPGLQLGYKSVSIFSKVDIGRYFNTVYTMGERIFDDITPDYIVKDIFTTLMELNARISPIEIVYHVYPYIKPTHGLSIFGPNARQYARADVTSLSIWNNLVLKFKISR